MVKISLSWPEKLKSRKIFSACVLSLMYDGKDFAHDAKLVFSLLTLTRYRDRSDLLRPCSSVGRAAEI